MIEHLACPPSWRAMRQAQQRFGGGAPSAPPPPPAPPRKSDAEIQEAAAQARARQRLRKGRQATYLTSGPGVAGDAGMGGQGTVVQRPTVLGGGSAA